MKGLLITGAVIAGLVIAGGASYFSAHNSGVDMEANISAQYRNNQNIYSSFTSGVMEAAGVAEAYTEQVKEVVTAALQGRYGDEGSQAVFQFLQEDNPDLDASVFIKVQQLIEAGRAKFENSQTKLIDNCVTYEKALGYAWGGFWLKLAGYPKKIDPAEQDAGDVCAPVINAATGKAFDSGVDGGVNPFGNN